MNESPAVTVAAPLCLIRWAWPGVLRQHTGRPASLLTDILSTSHLHHVTDSGRASLQDSDDRRTLHLTVAVETISELSRVLPKTGDAEPEDRGKPD